MPLKTLVKAGGISNLSDARYCAGMGVEMLGFRVNPADPLHIPAKLFQEIRGWVSGPKVVAELHGDIVGLDVDALIANYAPDLIELSYENFLRVHEKINLPCIVWLTNADSKPPVPGQIFYWAVSSEAYASIDQQNRSQCLVQVASADALAKIHLAEIAGIAIEGSAEIRPGFKSYDGIADILEALEDD